MDAEISKELNNLKFEEFNSKKERERYVNRMAFLLRGQMGEDIKNVTSGKIKVKLSWKEKIKYKLSKLFNIF